MGRATRVGLMVILLLGVYAGSAFASDWATTGALASSGPRALGAGSVPALPGNGTDSGELEQVSGVGEQLLIVVGGDYATEAEAAAAAVPFGEMQGFYVDASVNYTVLGLYDQVSPDLKRVPCDEATDPDLKAGCSGGLTYLKAYQPMSLRYVPATAASDLVARAAPCGDLDLPPCVGERFATLLTPDLQLAKARYLLLSAFRTTAGAASFAELARSAGSRDVVVLRVLKTGGGYVGLGQEAHPDGSGPLLAPLPDPEAYQR